ncbi:MAG: DUF1501 domain-containing protein [Planctomycetota bacterium]
MDRRDFLRLSGLSAGLLSLPVLGTRALVWAAGDDRLRSFPLAGRILVLVELHGGNDGLNTVIPYRSERYRELRPRLAIPRGDVLPLDDSLALHPSLKPLREIWDAREIALVLGVGYAQPNRSHFRSIEIWETGSRSDELLDEGWIARLLAGIDLPAERAADGILLGRGHPGPLAGPLMRNVALNDPKRFQEQASRLRPSPRLGGNRALEHVLGVGADPRRGARIIAERRARAPALGVDFPRSPLGRQFRAAAELVASGVPVQVIKLFQGGYDTHTNQLGAHARLLEQLAAGVAAFRSALGKAGLWKDVLLMTYSEFGRRAAQNGSGGTDHGTAAPHLLIGGSVRGGIYGEQPSLEDLAKDDLRHTVDYRRLYATVAREWWHIRGARSALGDFEAIRCIDNTM